jgi:hypothetical protein
VACPKAFELIGTKTEEELFNESRRAVSASPRGLSENQTAGR